MLTRRLLACAIVATAAPAAAEPVGGIAWHAPASCPEQSVLEAAIARRLDATQTRVTLAIDVEVSAADDGFVAQIAVRGAPDETRTLASASCAELADAVAVVIGRLATSVRVAEAPPVPAPVATPKRLWDGGVRASAIAGSDGPPGFGGGGEVGGWLSWGRIALELAGQRWLSGTAVVTGSPASVDVALETAVVRAGWRASRLRGWLVGELGTLRGTGMELDAARSGTGRWLAGGAGFGASLRLAPHVAAVAALEAEVVFDRVAFALAGGDVVYRSPPFVLHGAVSIELGWR